MKRSTRCKTCGMLIRPSAKDMSLGAATRKHYWRHHPDVMLRGQADRQWKREQEKSRQSKRA